MEFIRRKSIEIIKLTKDVAETTKHFTETTEEIKSFGQEFIQVRTRRQTKGHNLKGNTKSKRRKQ